MFDDPADLLRYHQMRIQALWRCRCQAHEPVSALRQFAHQSRFLTHAGIPYWAAVSDLLLTKLLPEMEAEAPRPDDIEGVAGGEPGAGGAKPETHAAAGQLLDALKIRVSKHNALLDDALAQAVSGQMEDEHGDRAIRRGTGAGEASVKSSTGEQWRDTKKQRVE